MLEAATQRRKAGNIEQVGSRSTDIVSCVDRMSVRAIRYNPRSAAVDERINNYGNTSLPRTAFDNRRLECSNWRLMDFS
ncbi:hypothetical protein [Bradyrhizobium sp. CCGUVB14]|uniref:hypothetical protein n=1 Tax=Bradyrhizobium sp. CCGUVB14 TaxID=2949628 RepID=UPI0020B1C06D|nr:hypothetical protein [Bradyrhizobium sp. CCGUVB14]MCP3445821.1 hypothetical protein [Bradyrhizobium sp. CCGUVB14]